MVAHGNSLRALVKMLDGLSEQAIVELNIPTGVPLLYEFDDALQPREQPLPRGPGSHSRRRRGGQAADGKATRHSRYLRDGSVIQPS